MKTTNNKNNIGVLTVRKFDENVLLKSTFDIDELFMIMLHDKDFVRFEILNGDKKLLLTNKLSEQASDVINHNSDSGSRA